MTKTQIAAFVFFGALALAGAASCVYAFKGSFHPHGFEGLGWLALGVGGLAGGSLGFFILFLLHIATHRS